MVKGRYYKAEYWNSTKNKYVEVLVTPTPLRSNQRLNYVDCKIIVGEHKGKVVAINVGMNSRGMHEFYTKEVMMAECAEYFI